MRWAVFGGGRVLARRWIGAGVDEHAKHFAEVYFGV